MSIVPLDVGWMHVEPGSHRLDLSSSDHNLPDAFRATELLVKRLFIKRVSQNCIGVLLVYKRPVGQVRPISLFRVLPAKGHIMRVEPRGFEPLASAVQMLGHGFILVSRRQEIRIYKRIFRKTPLSLSPDVNPGRCHVTVKSLSATRICEARFPVR